jgi:hypothetical protein
MSETEVSAAAPQLARLRGATSGAAIMLVIQFIFGDIFSLYGNIPSSGSFGLFSNGWLIVHEILAVALLVAAVQLVVFATRSGIALAKITSWIGLIGIVLAIGAGIGFTRNASNGSSLGMSIAFAIALISYVINLARLPGR